MKKNVITTIIVFIVILLIFLVPLTGLPTTYRNMLSLVIGFLAVGINLKLRAVFNKK
jgi:hypothetical protein